MLLRVFDRGGNIIRVLEEEVDVANFGGWVVCF